MRVCRIRHVGKGNVKKQDGEANGRERACLLLSKCSRADKGKQISADLKRHPSFFLIEESFANNSGWYCPHHSTDLGLDVGCDAGVHLLALLGERALLVAQLPCPRLPMKGQGRTKLMPNSKNSVNGIKSIILALVAPLLARDQHCNGKMTIQADSPSPPSRTCSPVMCCRTYHLRRFVGVLFGVTHVY